MEARVGVVVEGKQRALNSAQGSVVDGGARKFLQQQSQAKQSMNQSAQVGTVNQLLAGGIAGAFSKTCTAPLARLTILFQVQGMHSDVTALSKASIWHEASRIVNEEGFRAFWRGNLVTIAHRLPYSSVSFYAYERYKQLLHSLLGENLRGNASTDMCVHFLGGGMAGLTAASATYPLDLVRTRLAAQRNALYYRGIGHAFHTICREEGFLGLYKGLGATLLGVGPSIAISFSVYEALRSFWQSERPNDSTVMVSLACGSLSGIASSTATFPLDVVRRRMQLEGAGGRARIYNTGLVGTFKHIIRTEGLRGLYRGILPEYYKVVPSVGIVFMTYETLKMLLSRIQASDSCFSLGVSGISNSVMCAKRVILRLAIQHWVDLQSSYLNLTCLVVQVERTKMQVFLRLVGLLALPWLKAFLKFLLHMYQLASRAEERRTFFKKGG